MSRAATTLEQKEAWLRDRHSTEFQDCMPAKVPLPFAERHYTPAQLAEMWGLSADVIRRLFQDEPGVLVIGDGVGRRGKRAYTTLRIPESVVARVYRRMLRV